MVEEGAMAAGSTVDDGFSKANDSRSDLRDFNSNGDGNEEQNM